MPDIASIGPVGSAGPGSVGPLDRPGVSNPPSILSPGFSPGFSPTSSPANRPGDDRTDAPRADRVELSGHARFLDRLRNLSPVRQDRVESVRNEIAEGRYVTEDKLTAAVDGLLDDVFSE